MSYLAAQRRRRHSGRRRPQPRVFYVAHAPDDEYDGFGDDDATVNKSDVQDFASGSGDGFVDAAAEELLEIHPRMKQALGGIMNEAANLSHQIVLAEKAKDAALVKVLRGNLAYLQDSVVNFVTDIIEGVQEEATDAELDEFADQLVDDIANMSTMASTAMMDKESRDMQRCRALTELTADPDLAKSKVCRMLWDNVPNGVIPGCQQPSRAAPGCVGLSTGVFGKKKRPECDWGVPACKGKTFGECERIQDKADNCFRAKFTPPPMCAAAKAKYPEGYIKDRKVHARDIAKLCRKDPEFKQAMKEWKTMRFGHKSLRARIKQAALQSTTESRDLYNDCLYDKAYANCAARIGRKVGALVLKKAVKIGTAGIL